MTIQVHYNELNDTSADTALSAARDALVALGDHTNAMMIQAIINQCGDFDLPDQRLPRASDTWIFG